MHSENTQRAWILAACLSVSLALGGGCETNDPIAYVDADISAMDGGVDRPTGDVSPRPDGGVDPDGLNRDGLNRDGLSRDGLNRDGQTPDGQIAPDTSPDGPNPTCSNTCDVTFELADSGESDVILMGEFDDWSTGITMQKSGGRWTATVSLRHGQLVQYKFAKNGKTQWVTDPIGKTCKELGTNENSYLHVECPKPCAITNSDDWRDGVLYFVMLDRFVNGDKTNDDPVKDRFGQPVRPISDWNGGDLQGLIDKIKDGYFTRLGVNILWISNPIEAADGAWDGWGDSGQKDEIYTGYHGYWPTDMNKVEPRLGTRLKLKEMIQEAHQKGIKVIMDYPMNHVHQDSPHFKNHATWFWPLHLFGQDCICGSSACGWESAQRERCWFDPFLPDFNYTVPAAMTFSLNNLVSWAKDVGGDGSNVGFDGFRMDAVKHIDISWVTSMRKRLESEFPGKWLWTVGETFTGDKALIKAYVGPDKLDGQFDFPLHDEIRSKLIQRQGTMKNLGAFLQDNRCPYGGKSLMSPFLGNHDKQRVIHDAENKFYKRFSFPAQPTAAEPYERLAMGFTLLMTLPGVPLIYYGDEVGLAGGQDPDNRRMMPFNGKTYAQAGNDDAKTLSVNAAQEKLFKHIAKLTTIRHSNPALRRGYPEVDWNATTDQVLVYSMTFSGQTIIVAINRSDSTQNTINVGSGSYTDLLTNTSVSGSFSLPPRSAKILK